MSYDEIADDPVMPKSIDELLRTRGSNIPVIICYTADECISYVKGKFRDNFFVVGHRSDLFNLIFLSPDKSRETIETLNEYMPKYVRSLKSLKKLSEEDFERIYDTINNRFFEGKPINEKKIRKAIEALTHIYFELPIIVMIEDLVKRTTVSNYVCRFSYVGNEESAIDFIQKRQVSGKNTIFKIHYPFILGVNSLLVEYVQCTR